MVGSGSNLDEMGTIVDALALMVEVSNNPTVRAFDNTLSRFHARMVADYGPGFMDAETKDKNGFVLNEEGVKRWTPAQRDLFNRLYVAAKTYRAALRVSILAQR